MIPNAMSLLPADERKQSEHSKCFARSVVDALAEEPTLEAVTINRARKTISVATLGKSDEQKLSERLATGMATQDVLQRIDQQCLAFVGGQPPLQLG